MINYNLIRSKRKTLALYIRGVNVEVRAPLKTARRDIDAFVMSKEKWITEKLAQSQVLLKKRDEFRISYGDTVILRGAECPVVLRDGIRADFDGKALHFPPNLMPEQIKQEIVRIYRRIAKDHLNGRVAFFAVKTGIVPAAVKINGAKTRWGSCSAKRNINFSWRLMFADDAVIDYVVVHELAHIREMNHSTRFWAIVEGILPDYRERQKQLKSLQQRLSAEVWE